MDNIKISIVVPVKNGMDTLSKLIKGIQMQTLFNNAEIVVIDSGSTDGSFDFLSQFDFVNVISIDPSTFNHGDTRNLAVSHCKGEFVFMTVQDAWTTDEVFLDRMVSHFEDPEVMGVCGQQIVPHEKGMNPHEWFRPDSEGKMRMVQFENEEAFNKLSPKEKREACGWDDVNAMYRKKALLEIPFRKLAFGEDMLWAKEVLTQGYKLVYNHALRVNHYHFQFPEYTYRRTLITKVFIYKCFGYVDVKTFGFKDYLLVVYRNFKWKQHPKWIFHNFNIINMHRKATNTLIKAIENNSVPILEKELSLNVPMGKQNTDKHAE